jgi:hypothetical protein
MKNLFNSISQEEKNRILEMHSGKKNVISEQGIGSGPRPYPGIPNGSQKKISGNGEEFLKNKSSQVNPSIGLQKKSLNSCYEYLVSTNNPTTYGVSDDEVKKYIDYLGVYGKVPGTGIPIPYQGDDLNQMKYFLWGNTNATNGMAYGGVEERTVEEKGLIYPSVEKIRALYSKLSGKSLWDALQKKMTDSDEDMEKKNEIKEILVGAYQLWIDCANGKRKDIR